MLGSLFMNWFQTHDLLNREGPFTFCIDYIIWYIVVGLLIAVGIFFLNKYKTEKRIKIVLTVLWAVAVAIDLAKLIKNIYYGFNISGDIPFYICSLYLYTMPVVIWGKGLWQRMACTYNCTIGLFGAIVNYIMPNVVVNNSLFSFAGFHTTLYHTILIATPLVMLCTGFFKLKFKDFGWSFLSFVVITFPVVIFNYIAGTDYMYFREGGIELVKGIATTLSYGFPIVMYAVYAVVMILMQLLIMGITKLVEVIKLKIGKTVDSKQEQERIDVESSSKPEVAGIEEKNE